ncbi:MAG: glycosyltransferase [Acidobacteria bacterium]|nr:glycosyltransferase [Acidobacteriota bacterium]
MSILTRTWKAVRTEGLNIVLHKVRRRIKKRLDAGTYRKWVGQFDTIAENERAEMRERAEALTQKHLISVLMPVYNVDEKWLRKAIESVRAQIYPHWELCIADDNSTKSHIRPVLEEYAELDSRIKLVFRTENGHISAASNSALELVSGEFTALLDHDDELAEDALLMVAEAIDLDPDIDLIYSDEDLINENGDRYSPTFKPDWSPELFYSVNITTHLSVYRTDILRRIGGFRIGYEGSQDYDLALRFIEQTDAKNIRHIPSVLYHWRAIRGSVAYASDEKPYAHDRARKAINDHFERMNVSAKSVRGYGQLHRTIYRWREERPLVSVIVDLEPGKEVQFRESFSNTDYRPYELIFATEGSTAKPNRRTHEEASFFSRLNRAADAASGSVLCFLDASTVIKSDDWLDDLAALAVQEKIGAAGAKIVFPDNYVKHAGLILGIGGGVGRAHYGFHRDDPGEFVRLHVTQNFSAVSIECMAVRKEVFDAVGGFDAETFPDALADVDLCLRLLNECYRNVWTPWSIVTQTGKPTVASNEEIEHLRSKWPGFFERDPYYNPNFCNKDAEFRLAIPPRK